MIESFAGTGSDRPDWNVNRGGVELVVCGYGGAGSLVGEKLAQERDDDRAVIQRVVAHRQPLGGAAEVCVCCLLYTSPSPRDRPKSRMPSSA